MSASGLPPDPEEELSKLRAEVAALQRALADTERKKSEAGHSFERHQLETIFQESPAAMVLWIGPDFVFEKVNPHYQAIFPDRELLGKPFLEACPEFKDQPFHALLTKVLNTGEPFVGKEVLARHPSTKDGELEDHYYDFTYMRVNDAEGKPYGVYNHATDVTDKVLAKQKLIQALRDRDDLLSICSHELRTPVASMKLATQMFKRGLEKGDPKATSMERVRRMVDQSDRQLDRLTRLIEEMLDFSRIVGGKLPINAEALELTSLVSEALERIRPQLEAAGCDLSLQLKGPIRGQWDRFRIEQVLTNLFSNALKYGNGMPVEVTVEEAGGRAVITVTDHGIGIPAKDLDRIFSPYERAVSASNISGLGLGLFIASQIVKAHGGRILVSSELGRGSSFKISLPKSRSDVPTSGEQS